MGPENINIMQIVRRYRRPIIIAMMTLSTIILLGIVGASYAVYKVASFSTDKLKTLQPEITETVSDLPAKASGFLEESVLILASAWLQQQAVSVEVTQVKLGLSCFDALGGPSPTQIVSHVQRTVTDTALIKQLQDLAQSLGSAGPASKGPAACTNWILNS